MKNSNSLKGLILSDLSRTIAGNFTRIYPLYLSVIIILLAFQNLIKESDFLEYPVVDNKLQKM